MQCPAYLSPGVRLAEERTQRYSFCVKNRLFAIACLSFSSVILAAQMEVVEIEKPQLAKSVAGFVVDPSGAGLSGVRVEERSGDWKTVLRSTKTDDKGRFHFSNSGNKSVYYLQFSRFGFNWLRLKLQLDKTVKRPIIIKMPIGT